jgi:hypothetical protein
MRRMGERKGWKRGKESENGRKEKDGREEGWEKGGRRVKTGERRRMGERIFTPFCFGSCSLPQQFGGLH